MKKFIFTFGMNHPFKNYVQPIFAEDSETAREKMFSVYGDNWAFEYTEDNPPSHSYLSLPEIICLTYEINID